MNEVSNEIIIETLNNPIDGMEEAGAKAIQESSTTEISRAVSDNVITVSENTDLTDILTNERNENYNSTQTGDLLYSCGGLLGAIITGVQDS